MQFVDTHTHLYGEAFDEDRDEMVQRAIDSGIKQLYLPNIDPASIQPMYDLCARFPENCFPMMGLHPGSVNENWENDLEIIRTNLFTNAHIAVGEIGMDLYWDKTFKEQQAEAFRRQIHWAKELNLPIVIHAREAFDEIFEIVDALNDDQLTGVFHCFTGNRQQAQHILNYGGFYLGIGGVVTYKNSGLTEVLKSIDPKHLLLETDSPYLPPVPHRGERNESAFLMFVAEQLCTIYGLSLEDLASQTSENALKLFNPNPIINKSYQSVNKSDLN